MWPWKWWLVHHTKNEQTNIKIDDRLLCIGLLIHYGRRESPEFRSILCLIGTTTTG